MVHQALGPGVIRAYLQVRVDHEKQTQFPVTDFKIDNVVEFGLTVGRLYKII